jgi:GNAT superfamily N-acetyltransferase
MLTRLQSRLHPRPPTSVKFGEAGPSDRPFLESTLARAANNISVDTVRRDEDLANLINSWPNDRDFGYIAKHHGGLLRRTFRRTPGEPIGAAFVHYPDAKEWPRPRSNADEQNPELVIAVLPGFQGKQIGITLLQSVLNEAIRKGSNSVLLCVRDENTAAVKLYKKVGFKEVPESHFVTLLGKDARTWRKQLNEAV